MSRHQDIIDNLVARLKTITLANGYSMNLNTSVQEWDVSRSIDTIDESDLPLVDVRDADPVKVESAGYFEYEMPVDIDIYVSGRNSKSQARQLVYDVGAAIGTDSTLSGVADEIYPESYQIDVNQAEKLITSINIKLRVRFATAPWAAN